MIFGRDGADMYQPDFSDQSLALMQASFAVAREQRPRQPLTVGAWSTPVAGALGAAYETEIDRTALELSDIVTFHAYLSTEKVAGIIKALERHRRPMICTEWMARPVGSRIADQLELFRRRGVGCVQWGLVQGRTQTWLPWPEELCLPPMAVTPTDPFGSTTSSTRPAHPTTCRRRATLRVCNAG